MSPSVLAPGLALGSSLIGGATDFIGGTNSRRIGTLQWMVCTQLIGVVLAGCWVALSGGSLPPLASLAEAAGAGFSLMICLLAFFQAMVVGTISVVAPISATGVVIPIAAGIARGERPGAAQVVGILAAIAGIVLASRIPRGHARAGAESGLGLALLAALGDGFFLWLIAPASHHGGVAWAIFVARGVPALVLAAALAIRRLSVRPALESRTTRAMLLSALLAFVSMVLYAYATLHGALSIVSVLGSLYPVVTVLLAYHVLGERVHRAQQVGIAGVLAGVVLLSAG